MSTRTHQQSNKPGLNTLGGFANVNFPENLNRKQAKLFIEACEYRIKQFQFLRDFTFEEFCEGATPEELQTIHMNFRIEMENDLMSEQRYYAIFSGHYAPVNVALVQQTIDAYDKAAEYAKIMRQSGTAVSDMKLDKHLYRAPTTRPVSDDDFKEYKKIREDEENTKKILGQQTDAEKYGEDYKPTSYYTDEIDLAMQDVQYDTSITDVFELFRLAQFDMLNTWERKAVVMRLRNVYTDPSFVFPDNPEKNTTMDMFEANIYSMLLQYESVQHMREHYGISPICEMIDDNIMAAKFEMAQTHLYISLYEGYETPFARFISVDPQYNKVFDTVDLNTYVASIPESQRRVPLEAIEDADTIGYLIPSFSALQFENMSPEAQAGFDRMFNKEIKAVVEKFGLDEPPPAAHFRAMSLKYEPYL